MCQVLALYMGLYLLGESIFWNSVFLGILLWASPPYLGIPSYVNVSAFADITYFALLEYSIWGLKSFKKASM